MDSKLNNSLKLFTRSHGSVQIDRTRIKNVARDAESNKLLIISIKNRIIYEYLVPLPSSLDEMIPTLIEAGNNFPEEEKGVPGIVSVVINDVRVALSLDGEYIALEEDDTEIVMDHEIPVEAFFMSFMASYLTGHHDEAKRFCETAASQSIEQALKEALTALANMIINNYSRRFTVIMTEDDTALDAVNSAVDALSAKVKGVRDQQTAEQVECAQLQMFEVMATQLAKPTEWDIRLNRVFPSNLKYYSAN